MKQRSAPFSPASAPARKRGFSLIEVILSVGVLGIAILTLVGLVGASFLQIDGIVQTNRAISVGTTLEAALYTPELIGSEGKGIDVKQDKLRSNAIYGFVRDAVNGKKKTLFYISTEIQNSQAGANSEKTVIYYPSGGNLTRSVYNQMKGIGPVFRIEISIAKQLEQQRITLDDNGNLLDVLYTGGPLPDVKNYAPAYIPLHVAIYPHNFVNNANRQTAPTPITTLIINFQR